MTGLADGTRRRVGDVIYLWHRATGQWVPAPTFPPAPKEPSS